MTPPFISCVCLTYARVEHLQEAVQCFLDFRYEGRKQLVILNTFPQQELVFDHPEVKVVNLRERPATLGQARNIAISHAEGELLTVHDDDDLYLPNHLSNFASGFQPGNGWVKLDRQFHAEAWKIKSISHGTANVVAFTKEAWKKVGGYNAMNCGEDQHFIGKISMEFPGEIVTLNNCDLSFIYGWDNNAYHLSGQGNDKPNQPTGLQRTEAWVQDLVKARKIPTGRVILKPALKHDYERMAGEFTRCLAQTYTNKLGKVGIVLLGRYGDILNILPVAKYIHDHYGKPKFFVSRQFADLLDGVSYVQPEILDMPHDCVNEALKVANSKCQLVINAQVWGKDFHMPRNYGTYNTESWRHAGFMEHFYNRRDFPLILDKRSQPDDGPPVVNKFRILVNVHGGHSSPFKDADELLVQIISKWKEQFEVVDMSMLKAKHIYNMVGLLDQSALLITSDTAALHLAAASNIPVIALVNDHKCDNGVEWLGSMPRCNCILRMRYSDVLNNIDQIHNIVKDAPTLERSKLSAPSVQHWPVKRKLIHAVSLYREDSERNNMRKYKAQQTWKVLYEQGVIPSHDSSSMRNATNIGDRRKLPYLKDVLSTSMGKAGLEDIIFWTNDDNSLHEALPEMLRMYVSIYGGCTSFRCEFPSGKVPDLKAPPDSLAAKAIPHMGRDLFAATKRWLVAHWEEIPDFILGAPEFDLCLASMVRRHKGFHTTRQNIEKVIPCCELPMGYVHHEAHDAVWSRLPDSTPSHAHNRQLFKDWAQSYAPDMRIPL